MRHKRATTMMCIMRTWMHNKRRQLARASHWHIVISVLPVCGVSQRRLSLIWVGGGGVQIRSWDNCGWLWSLSGGGIGQGSGLQRALKNCKFPPSSFEHVPCRAQCKSTERRERGRKRKKSVLHSQMILIWWGLECNLDQTQPCKWVRVFIIRCLWRGVERGRARTAEVGVASRPRVHWQASLWSPSLSETGETGAPAAANRPGLV